MWDLCAEFCSLHPFLKQTFETVCLAAVYRAHAKRTPA